VLEAHGELARGHEPLSLPERLHRGLGRARGLLGVPVNEWAHTVTFAVRTLPLLRDEFRVLIAARRLRTPSRAANRRTRTIARSHELLDLVIAVVASAGRRASDLGRTATQRGGLQSFDR